MKKTFILVLCLSMFIGQRSVLAKPMEIEEKLFQETLQQSKNVTGLLTDEYGNPIIGATILVKGTTQGVISDINGRFSIRVAVGETLSFSFIGYENVEKKVTSETEVFNIRMIEESTSLKDVVIVGFGKQKKASVVGAISSVKPESFKLPTSSLSASLAGRMSGVIAVQRSGEPGGDGADFWIRGIGTNGANSAPLILLDGVEISSGDLNDIQPDDIQSFSILKDASATALYGVRGANGVMIVTTKEGATNEKISVKARLENSWSMPSYHLDMVDGPTYMRMYNEALKNDDPNTSPMYSEDRIQGTIKAGEKSTVPISVIPAAKPEGGGGTVELEEIRVVAESVFPYKKTLTGVFKRQLGNQYVVEDESGRNAAVLTMVCADGEKDITVTLPSGVIPDEADIRVTGYKDNKCTFHSPGYGIYSLVLLKSEADIGLSGKDSFADAIDLSQSGG